MIPAPLITFGRYVLQGASRLKPLHWLIIVAALVLLFGGAAVGWALSNSAKNAQAIELADLRSDKAEAEAKAAGFETQVVQQSEDLRLEVHRNDSLEVHVGKLVDDLTALQAEMIAVGTLGAQASGSDTATAVEHGAPEDHDWRTEAPDSVTTIVQDDVIRAEIAYYPAFSRFRLDWLAQWRAAVVMSELPNGDLLFGVKSLTDDDRLSFTVDDFVYEPPDLPPGPGFWQRPSTAWGTGAAVAVGTVCLYENVAPQTCGIAAASTWAASLLAGLIF